MQRDSFLITVTWAVIEECPVAVVKAMIQLQIKAFCTIYLNTPKQISSSSIHQSGIWLMYIYIFNELELISFMYYFVIRITLPGLTF